MTSRSDSARVVLALVVAVASVSCGGDEFEDTGDGTGGSSPDGSSGSGAQGGGGSGGSSGAGGSGGVAGGTGGAGGSAGGAGGSAGGVSDASAGTGDAGGTDGSTGQGSVEIQQIQDGTIDLGAEVRVEKVFITATRQQTSGGLNFVLQEPQGQASGGHPYPEYAAIIAFAPPATAAGIDNRSIGDCVDVMGTVDEFQEATQITVATVELAAECGTVPTPFNVPGDSITFADIATDVDVNAPGEQPGARAEAFEAVLVEIQAIEAASAPDSMGLFRAVEQSNVTGPNLIISDFYYAIAATSGQHFVSLTGIFTQFGSYQLNPRSIGDVVQ